MLRYVRLTALVFATIRIASPGIFTVAGLGAAESSGVTRDTALEHRVADAVAAALPGAKAATVWGHDAWLVELPDHMGRVIVRAEHGIVTLDGWLLTRSLSRAVVAIARAVPGVRAVDNDLFIGEPEGPDVSGPYGSFPYGVP